MNKSNSFLAILEKCDIWLKKKTTPLLLVYPWAKLLKNSAHHFLVGL